MADVFPASRPARDRRSFVRKYDFRSPGSSQVKRPRGVTDLDGDMFSVVMEGSKDPSTKPLRIMKPMKAKKAKGKGKGGGGKGKGKKSK
eukprot:6109202-Pyramimonas_sp.AAC.1